MNNSTEIVIRIDRKTGLLIAAAVFVVWAAAAFSESLTLTTTYPAPSGIYNQLVTTGNSGTAAADTTLNRNAGNTVLVPGSNAAGRVGIGTNAPGAKLEVAGQIKITGGSPGAGKILTSDASGLASWAPAASGTLSCQTTFLAWNAWCDQSRCTAAFGATWIYTGGSTMDSVATQRCICCKIL